MKKIAKLIYQYRYPRQKTLTNKLWKGEGNIGDCIQTIAVCNALNESDILLHSSLINLNRDDIRNYTGEEVILPMQAWYGNAYGVSCSK